MGFVLLGLLTMTSMATALDYTDSDGDGMPDWWETRSFGTESLDVHQNDSQKDPDGDGLNNINEYNNGSNPFDPDTDQDGLVDGLEVHRYSTNPLMSDTDGGGHPDGFEIQNGRNPLDPDDDLGGITVTIHLLPGWNLFSLPLIPQNTAITSVTAPIAGKFISIWSYRNGAWRTFDPNIPAFSDLASLEAGLGYWINMTTSAHLTVSGSPAPRRVDLVSGWNLVGYNFSASQDAGTALSSISGKLINIWTFSDEAWKAYDPVNPEFSNLSHLQPGKGYWINATADCAWTLP